MTTPIQTALENARDAILRSDTTSALASIETVLRGLVEAPAGGSSDLEAIGRRIDSLDTRMADTKDALELRIAELESDLAARIEALEAAE